MLPVYRSPFAGPSNRLFDQVFKPNLPLAVWADDAAVQLELDLPGVRLEDVTVSVHDGVLTVEGERKPARADARVEHRRFGRFTHRLALPDDVDADKVEARLSNGVLAVTLPKVPASQPRKVSVQVG